MGRFHETKSVEDEDEEDRDLLEVPEKGNRCTATYGAPEKRGQWSWSDKMRGGMGWNMNPPRYGIPVWI